MLVDTIAKTMTSDSQQIINVESLIDTLRKDESKRRATPAQLEHRREALAKRVDNPEVADRQLERILQGNDLTDVNYLSVGVTKARSVARIVLRRNDRLFGYATGFLVAPGVLLTNQHVFQSPELIGDSIAQFGYERDLKGMELDSADFAFDVDPQPIICKPLDFAIAALKPVSICQRNVHEFGWLKLSPTPGKAFVGEYLTIIQHPGGQRKQICVRENRLLKYVEETPFIWYQTDTVSGSSGSPAFNNSWDVVALHHKCILRPSERNDRKVSLPSRDPSWNGGTDGREMDCIANQGIRISKILDHLSKNYADHPLAKAVLSARDVSSFVGDDASGRIRIVQGQNGRTKVVVPVTIDLNVSFGTET